MSTSVAKLDAVTQGIPGRHGAGKLRQNAKVDLVRELMLCSCEA